MENGSYGRAAFAIACAAALLVSGALTLSCGSGERELPMEYDRSSDVLLLEYSVSGGPPAPWDDAAPEFALYGDGTAIRRDGSGESGMLLQAGMDEESVMDLLLSLEDTGFFDLEDEYVNPDIADGVIETITVNLAAGTTSVRVSMMEVEEFDAADHLLMSYPIGVVEYYLPDEGYLVVEEGRDTDETAVVDPSQPIHTLLPDADSLISAAEEGRPLAVGGEDFLAIKKFESEQEYRGLAVDAAGVVLVIFPVYETR